MSVAAVQEHLHAFGWSDLIQIGPYLTKLCGTLAASMIGDSRPVSLQVLVDSSSTVSLLSAARVG
jgi:two-component sensor histidine kinase